MRIIILYELKGKAMELRNCEHLRELSDSDMIGSFTKNPSALTLRENLPPLTRKKLAGIYVRKLTCKM